MMENQGDKGELTEISAQPLPLLLQKQSCFPEPSLLSLKSRFSLCSDSARLAGLITFRDGKPVAGSGDVVYE